MSGTARPVMSQRYEVLAAVVVFVVAAGAAAAAAAGVVVGLAVFEAVLSKRRCDSRGQEFVPPTLQTLHVTAEEGRRFIVT